MSEFEEQPAVSDKERLPTAEAPVEGGLQESTDFSKLQKKGESLLKTILPDGEAHVEKLGLADNSEAKKASEKYNSQRKSIGDKIKEKLALIATVGALTFGASSAEASRVDSSEVKPLSPTEQILSAEKPLVNTASFQEKVSGDSLESQIGKIDVEKSDAGTESVKRAEETSAEEENSLDKKDLKELTETATIIADACLGTQTDGCLITVSKLALEKTVTSKIKELIPLASVGEGFSKIGEAFSDKEMTAGKRFGSAVRGVFDLVTSAAAFNIGGSAVIGLARLYQAYKTVDNVKGAYDIYEKNKKDIHAVLGMIFKDSPEKKQAVEEVLVTLEKVGDSTKETPSDTRIN